MNKSKLLLFLTCVKGIGFTSLRTLINNGCFDNLTLNNMEDILTFLNINSIFLSAKVKNIISNLTIDDLNNYNIVRKELENKLIMHDASYISYFDDIYPKRLKFKKDNRKNDYPIILYYKGDINLLNAKKTCGIIGTRNPSSNAMTICKKLSSEMSKEYVVVSGLALGCDTLAHQSTLDSNGKTIAVIATGVDKIYPITNKKLVQNILNTNGLILSEYPIGYKTSKFSFVERDRIQAMLSDIMIVIQTNINGGSMHASKACANDYFKKILTISPNLLEDNTALGNQFLIDEYNAIEIEEIKIY